MNKPELPVRTLVDTFKKIPEYRKNLENVHHKLCDIIAIVEHFNTIELGGKNVSHVVEEEVSHGREEHREYYQVTIPKNFPEASRWSGAKTIGMAIRTHRKGKGKRKREVRYYISTERRHGKDFARYVRKHWGIEIRYTGCWT